MRSFQPLKPPHVARQDAPGSTIGSEDEPEYHTQNQRFLGGPGKMVNIINQYQGRKSAGATEMDSTSGIEKQRPQLGKGQAKMVEYH